MNLINEEIKALRVAIEQINILLSQPRYKDVAPILRARKKDYLDELKRKVKTYD